MISAELTAESQDGTRGPVRGSRGTCSGPRGKHSLGSGLAWIGPARRSSWVPGVAQAFRPRAGPCGAPLRTVATWGRTLCLFETRGPWTPRSAKSLQNVQTKTGSVPQQPRATRSTVLIWPQPQALGAQGSVRLAGEWNPEPFSPFSTRSLHPVLLWMGCARGAAGQGESSLRTRPPHPPGGDRPLLGLRRVP